MTRSKVVSVVHVASVSAAGHGFMALVAVWILLLILLGIAPAREKDLIAGNIDGMIFALALIVPVGFAALGFVCGVIGAVTHNTFVKHCTVCEEIIAQLPLPPEPEEGRAVAA